MARTYPAAHTALASGSTSDYLFLLRCDEAAAATNLTDAMGVRTMTHTASPGVVPSLLENNATQGARDFNGTTQYAGRTSDTDETLFQSMVWGFACWIRPDTLPVSRATIAEYGEWSNPITSATNPQFMLSLMSDGSLRFDWRSSTTTARNNSTAVGLIAAGSTYHIGISCEPDPDNAGQMVLRFYINGECVQVVPNRPPPFDGASSRWIIGASRVNGTAVGTPGAFFDGRLDDIVVTKWTPGPQWFRHVYARGTRDFTTRATTSNHWQTHHRVLVHVGTSDFATLKKIDCEWVDLDDVKAAQKIGFVKDVSWSDSVETFVQQATIKLLPRYFYYNMSPFVPSAGSLNENQLTSGTAHLLTSMRRIRIETAIVPAGMEREQATRYFELMFDGFIRSVDVSDSDVTVTAADLGVAMTDVFIEPDKDGKDRLYGSAGGIAVETELQDIINDNDPARFEILSIDDSGATVIITLLDTATVNGRGRPHPFQAGDTVTVTGTVNFNGTYTIGSVTTNTIVTTTAPGAFAAETVGICQGTENRSYKCRKPTLYVPTSPAWSVFEWYEPASKSVLQACDDIMSQLGWRVRFKWHELRQEFRLTVYNPQTSYGSFNPEPRLKVNRLSTKVDDVRDVLIVEYPNNADKDPTGERKPYIVTSKDTTSMRSFGRMMARIRVASDSLINASGEAQELADSIKNDLKNPKAEMEVETLYDQRIEVQDETYMLGETISYAQMAQMFGEDVAGACISVEHVLSEREKRTKIKLANVAAGLAIAQSTSRVERHYEMFSFRGVLKARGLSAPVTPSAPTIINLGAINGNRMAMVTWATPGGDKNRAWFRTEVHRSTSNGFTPSSSTLQHTVDGTSTILTGHTVGVTYYVKIVHRDLMRNRAESAQASFVS